MAVLKFKGDLGNWRSIPAIQGAQGIQGLTGATGATGTNGADGDTPSRGTDYWTAEDIAAIEAHCEDYIDSEILGGTS